MANLGDAGEYFHDLGTDLYWCDPATFVGQTRDQVVDWLAAHAAWRWATAAEVYALLGKMSADDGLLTAVLGAAQFTIGNGGPRWIGYYAQATAPDGLLLESSFAPSFHLLTAGGTQGGVAGWNPGAWVVSDVDPTPVETTTWGAVKAGLPVGTRSSIVPAAEGPAPQPVLRASAWCAATRAAPSSRRLR